MVVEGNGTFRFYQVTILSWARAAVKAVGVTASQANHVGEVTRSGSKSGHALHPLRMPLLASLAYFTYR